MKYTVRTLIEKLRTFDPELPVAVAPRYPEFDLTLDACVPPDATDLKLLQYVFIDPIETYRQAP